MNFAKERDRERKKIDIENRTFAGSILSYKLRFNRTRSSISLSVSGCLAE